MRSANKSRPRISVIDRRLKSGAVFGLGAQPIPLVEPTRWVLRVVNTQISDDRLWHMQAEKGWAYVELADLAVRPDEIGFRERDGRIVRGTQGYEVLMKMNAADYRQLQAAKDRAVRESTFGKKGLKQAITAAASAPPTEDGSGGLGSDGRAAEFLDHANMTVIDSIERVPLDD